MVGAVIGALFTAFIIGALARFALPGPDPMPPWLTILIGLGGSAIGYGIVYGAIGKHGAAGEDIGKLSHLVVNATAWPSECIRLRGEWRRARARWREGGIKSNEWVALLYFESQKLCRTSPG